MILLVYIHFITFITFIDAENGSHYRKKGWGIHTLKGGLELNSHKLIDFPRYGDVNQGRCLSSFDCQNSVRSHPPWTLKQFLLTEQHTDSLIGYFVCD